MQRCQTEMKYENKKIRIMNKKVAKVKTRVRQSFWCIFRFLCIWLDGFVLFFLFCQEKMQRRASAIFFFNFLDGWILFAIFATKKDAAEIKLRVKGGASTSLQLASVWRALPVVVVVEVFLYLHLRKFSFFREFAWLKQTTLTIGVYQNFYLLKGVKKGF